ncbi:MAG: hypothetical protein U5P41_04240 [Gammaproteobacteria bacterium]|nr:hypothetical protein [Gammaproteobacteria bacterium]
MKYTRELGGILNTDPWILQVFVVVFLTVLISFVARYFINGLYKRLGRTETLWEDALVDAMRKPLSALIYVIGLSFAMQIIFRQTGTAIFDESVIQPVQDTLVIGDYCLVSDAFYQQGCGKLHQQPACTW